MRRRSVLLVRTGPAIPADHRLVLQCHALCEVGYTVCVIRAEGSPEVTALPGVHVYTYRVAPLATGRSGHALRVLSTGLLIAWLSVRAFVRHRFAVIQVDGTRAAHRSLVAGWRLIGIPYVLDQPDVDPDAPAHRRGRRRPRHVFVTNESQRRIALEQGYAEPDVSVLPVGPDPTRARPVRGTPPLRRGRAHLLVHVGTMDADDDVVVLLEVLHVLVNEMERTDVHLALLGFGDQMRTLSDRAFALGLRGFITFTGRTDDELTTQYLSTAHLGLSPDRRTPRTEAITPAKIVQYLAHALPIVSFDLTPARAAAGDSAVCVEPGDVVGFAQVVGNLLDDAPRRARMARLARARYVAEFDPSSWSYRYVRVFEQLLGRRAPASSRTGNGHLERRTATRAALPRVAGRPVVDLRDPRDFEAFLAQRDVKPPSMDDDIAI